jgi:hypothetical protein
MTVHAFGREELIVAPLTLAEAPQEPAGLPSTRWPATPSARRDAWLGTAATA